MSNLRKLASSVIAMSLTWLLSCHSFAPDSSGLIGRRLNAQESAFASQALDCAASVLGGVKFGKYTKNRLAMARVAVYGGGAFAALCGACAPDDEREVCKIAGYAWACVRTNDVIVVSKVGWDRSGPGPFVFHEALHIIVSSINIGWDSQHRLPIWRSCEAFETDGVKELVVPGM